MVSVPGISNNINNSAQNVAPRKMMPSFRGYSNLETKAIEHVTNQFPKALKFLNWIEKNRGEKTNAWITAIGTAFIAPIFIALNPFSKEDKDTKIYSAWRQPISAVIALAAQVFITRKFEHFLDRSASTGRFLGANLKAAPAESYVEKLLRLQHPEYDAATLKTEIEKFGLDSFKKEVFQAREALKDKTITNEMLVGRKDYEDARQIIAEKFKDKIKDMPKKEASAFIEKESVDYAAKNILEKLSINAEKKFRIREIAAKGTHTLESALAEVTDKLSYFKTDAKMNSAQTREFKVLTAMAEQLENMKAYESKLGLKPFASVKNIGSTLPEILQNIKIKQVVQAGVENAKFSLKQYKVWLGMGVTLLTLPLSCGLLNWSYPRIMEKIMPHAYRKKQCPPPPPQNHAEQRKEAKV